MSKNHRTGLNPARSSNARCPTMPANARTSASPATGRPPKPHFQLRGVELQRRRRWYLERRPWRSLEILGGGVRRFSGQCLRGVVSVLNGLRGVAAGTDGGSAFAISGWMGAWW
jgi:hypothetical protein